MRRLTHIAPAIAAAAVLGSAALAGPPAICHPVEIGEQASLPWGSKPFAKKRTYRLSRLVDDTMTILGSSRSALVHMETLRRAALYTDDDAKVAAQLMAGLCARALDAEAEGRPDALAWFDAGYLAQCYDQLGVHDGLQRGSKRGVAGYGWASKALELAGDDPELQFGAAMMTVLSGIQEHDEHVARVKTLAGEETLVARNLHVHASRYWHHRRHAGGA